MRKMMPDCCEEKAVARQNGMFEGPVGDDWYPCKCKGKVMVNVSTTRTFSLSQDDILQIIADYLNANQGIEVSASDLSLDIADSSRGGYFDDQYTPARIKSVSVTVGGDK